jgi:hypothetical protein
MSDETIEYVEVTEADAITYENTRQMRLQIMLIIDG